MTDSEKNDTRVKIDWHCEIVFSITILQSLSEFESHSPRGGPDSVIFFAIFRVTQVKLDFLSWLVMKIW